MSPEIKPEAEVMHPVKSALEQLGHNPEKWKLSDMYAWLREEKNARRPVNAAVVFNKYPDFVQKDNQRGVLRRSIMDMLAIIEDGSISLHILKNEIDSRDGTARYHPEVPQAIKEVTNVIKVKEQLRALVGQEVNEDITRPGTKVSSLEPSEEIAELYEKLYKMEPLKGYKVAIGYYYMAAARYEIKENASLDSAQKMSTKADQFIGPADLGEIKNAEKEDILLKAATNLANATNNLAVNTFESKSWLEIGSKLIPGASGWTSKRRFEHVIALCDYGTAIVNRWKVDTGVKKDLIKNRAKAEKERSRE